MASVSDPRTAALAAMQQAGCAPARPEVIVFDGQLHRFQVEGDKKGRRNGWYVFYGDGVPAGRFGSWKTGHSESWCAGADPALGPAERQAWERQLAAAQARRRQIEQAQQAAARQRAAQLWQQTRYRVDAQHPYLLSKQIPALGVRQLGSLLVVPVSDIQGGLHGLQFIAPDGGKRFLTHGATEGHCHVLGSLAGAPSILICEGYATAVSLRQASGLPVVLAFNAGNLLPVARQIHRHFPTAHLLFAADDDRNTFGNPGRTLAEQAAQAVAGRVIWPDFSGLDIRSNPTDFNDLQVLGGRARLKAQLARALGRPSHTSRQAVSEAATLYHRLPQRDSAMRSTTKRSAHGGHPRKNTYQAVTDRIIELIERGTVPWQYPWDRARRGCPSISGLPVNAVTGKAYRGINVMLLLAAGLDSRDPGDPRWCGFQQAKSKGWKVKAGEHGTTIVFFKSRMTDDDPLVKEPDPFRIADESDRPVKTGFPLLRSHTVFHASQIEGIPPLETLDADEGEALVDHDWQSDEDLEDLIRRTGAVIHHGGDEAFYTRVQDFIQLPPCERFHDSTGYFGTAFHELGHWTGHESRLNRPPILKKDRAGYAREELRAELASAFIGAELGIHHDLESHAGYLDHYLDILRSDPKEIFRAAREAQGMADLIMDRHPLWQLQDGICVQRVDPVTDTGAPRPSDPTLTASIPVVPAPAPADPPAPSETPTTRPFAWIATALEEIHPMGDDDSTLGRLSRRIDAAFIADVAVPQSTVESPARQAPGPTPNG
ncbi:MAG: DUF1738 domain-containing protein [Gammaproteobacteria bacterium]|nr:DUF1738 domain-containing protein [Gammaproteobacteria bacterium]